MRRRAFIAGLATWFSGLGAFGGVAHAAKLTPTPSDQEGPFYPVVPIPPTTDLINDAGGVANGDTLALSGTLVDSNGSAVSGAAIEIWQCDAQGIYRHPRDRNHARVDPHFASFAVTKTDTAGRWNFLTLVPVPYGERPPHIHVRIRRGDDVLLTTQLYLKGHNTEGGWLTRNTPKRKRLSLKLVRESADHYTSRYKLVVAT